jgi:hypothetical protein
MADSANTIVPPEAAEAARVKLLALLKKLPELSRAYGLLVYTRQIYGLARLDVQRLLRHEIGDAEMRTTVEDILVRSAESQSRAGFEHRELVEGVSSLLVPYLTDLQVRFQQEDREQRQDHRENYEQQRRNRKVPLGFAYQGEETEIARDRSLVLVGDVRHGYRILDHVVRQVFTKNPPWHIIRFGCEPALRRPTAPEDQAWQNVLYIPVDHWRHCGESVRQLKRHIGKFVGPWLESGIFPDLLLVDDLTLLTRQSAAGPAKLKSAHRALRQVADDLGAGVVASAPVNADYKSIQLHTAQAHHQCFPCEDGQLELRVATERVTIAGERFQPRVTVYTGEGKKIITTQ